MEFARFVVLSTAHVRIATAERLTAWALLPPSEQPIGVAATPCGWFLPTRFPAQGDGADIPDELHAILAFGRNRGCAYVLLDSDGDHTDALPTFPW